MKSIYQLPLSPFSVKNNHAENRIKGSLFLNAEDKAQASEAECYSCHPLPVSLLEGPIKIEKDGVCVYLLPRAIYYSL